MADSNGNLGEDYRGAAILYRRIGRSSAPHLAKLRISPNRLSTLGFLAGAAAAYFFSTGGYQDLLYGTFLYQLCIIIDYADGDLARLTKSTSHLGRWLESTFDLLREFLVIFGICWGLYAETPDVRTWILGFVLCGTNFMMDIQALTYDAYPFAKEDTHAMVSSSFIHRIAAHVLSMRTTRYLSSIPFALLDQMHGYLVFFCGYNILVYSLMTLRLGKIIRERDNQEARRRPKT